MKKEFQLLNSEIVLKTDNPELKNVLNFVSQEAKQHGFLCQNKTVYVIEKTDSGYRICGDGIHYNVVAKQWDLTYTLIKLVHERAFREMEDCVRIHAGCGNYKNARFIMIGDKGEGKTTLMLKLLFERNGYSIHGDELVMIYGNKAMSFPRRFHVKPGTMALLPNIKPYLKKSPCISIYKTEKLYAFSPAQVGFDWTINSEKISAIFYLILNHGEKTALTKCSGLEMIQKIIPMSYYKESGEHLKINKLCRIMNEAKTYILSIGNLDTAARLIQKEMRSLLN